MIYIVKVLNKICKILPYYIIKKIMELDLEVKKIDGIYYYKIPVFHNEYIFQKITEKEINNLNVYRHM